MRSGFYRPPSLIKLKAGLDTNGIPHALEAKGHLKPSLHVAQNVKAFSAMD